MRVRLCDICLQPLDFQSYKIKMKKEVCAFWETSWEKVEICPECADKIIYAIRLDLQEKRRNENS